MQFVQKYRGQFIKKKRRKNTPTYVPDQLYLKLYSKLEAALTAADLISQAAGMYSRHAFVSIGGGVVFLDELT